MINEPTAYGSGEMILFLPSGKLEPGEETAVSANRELQEEIGFAAGRLDRLAELHPWVKYLTATLTVYLARDLTPSRLQGDEPYEIVPEYVSLNSFEGLIASGRLTDLRSLRAVLARQISPRKMIRYLTQRALAFIPTLLGVSLLIFTAIRLVPGDAITAMLGTESGC